VAEAGGVFLLHEEAGEEHAVVAHGPIALFSGVFDDLYVWRLNHCDWNVSLRSNFQRMSVDPSKASKVEWIREHDI
jgi:hypothetical protein